ncbi:CARDB domain-containing protein [Natronoarchaeum rubrum]|uniref:CARDB domain-containing protein n=1 Tax=Natronoarchaeum rubrum TaxID=755311 RepID=UPI0021122A19|nr:CARDB domain-containing protein [Natronoarchaeum rubrum]
MTPTTSRPPHHSGPTASSDGSRNYDPRKDPKVIGIAVIVFGTLAIAIAGVGSTPIVGGDGGGGTVFPFQDVEDDALEEVRISMAANRTTLRPGESVRFTATYENGTPASGASIAVDGTKHSVDDRGRATVTFEAGGSYTATASKSNTEAVRYVADGTIISVERYEIALAVTANRTTVTAGDDVAFTVRRADTGDAVSATVSVADESYATDDRGRAVASIPRADSFDVTASRKQTATQRYVSDTVTVRASPRRVRLALSRNRSAVRPGETVALTLFRTDTGETVEGTVTVDDRTTRTVGGTVTVSRDRAGSYDLRATRTDTNSETFVAVEETLEVSRYAAPVSLSANRTDVEPGDAVRFSAERADTGAPLTGQLTVGNRTLWLDRQGEATVRFTEAGEVPVVARRANTSTHWFPADELTVSVRDTSYRVRNVESPDAADRNANATIRAAVKNVGSDMGTARVTYRFDGAVVATDSVALGPGQSETVRFDVPTDAEPGIYRQVIAVRDHSARSDIEIRPAGGNDE